MNQFLSKVYHATEYNCSHFVRDVWLFLTGNDIEDLVVAWNCGQLPQAMKSRKGLTRIDKPQQPCIIMLQRPNEPPHVGVYIERKIFHMTADGGPILQDLSQASQGYKVSYYLA